MLILRSDSPSFSVYFDFRRTRAVALYMNTYIGSSACFSQSKFDIAPFQIFTEMEEDMDTENHLLLSETFSSLMSQESYD